MWSFYFLAKLYLYFRGYIRFHFILNLLFAIFILLPVPKKAPFYKYLKAARFFLSLTVAFLLAWYDSWFPPLFHSIQLLMETEGIATGYIIRFIFNILSSWETAVIILMFFICIAVRNRITLAPVVFILMLIVLPFEWGKASKEDPGGYLAAFYRSEGNRVIRFEELSAEAIDFDIIILHVCSLSWDDIKAVGMEEHPFFKQFHYLFTNFNTVSSYTNPSVIRLLRANCGQRKHEALYQDEPRECFLLESLRYLGYETSSIVDNDAPPSYHYVYDMITYGLSDPPMDFKDTPVVLYDFDNSPIYDDLALFKKWWDIRHKSSSERAALYFDITTLHTGARWVKEKDWWQKDRIDRYRESLLYLFGIFEQFFNQMASSGRNFVIVFIPEHGAALQGTKIQPPELRDIPLPRITLVPVGIKLIGDGHSPVPEHQKIISKPTSYLAVSYMLSCFLKEPPFGPGSSVPSNILDNIPETKFVSENKEAVIVKKDEDYFLYGKEKKWFNLSSAEK